MGDEFNRFYASIKTLNFSKQPSGFLSWNETITLSPEEADR